MKKVQTLQLQLSEVEKSINYLNIQLEDNKEPKKNEVKEDEIKICKFNRMGFCRERQNCPYFHATKVCQEYFNSGVCSKQRCCERHPRKCIYFDRGECQWDSQCKYLHKGITNVQRDDEDSQKHDEESIESIMAKAKAFEFDESLLDEEENRQNEESIETIMAKAKAFELEESFLDEEV